MTSLLSLSDELIIRRTLKISQSGFSRWIEYDFRRSTREDNESGYPQSDTKAMDQDKKRQRNCPKRYSRLDLSRSALICHEF